MITWTIIRTVDFCLQQKSQQLAEEATAPDSVISSCQIDKHSTGFLCLKKMLNVLRKQNDLIYGIDFPCRNPTCFFGVDYWFPYNQSFEDLVGDTEEKDKR